MNQNSVKRKINDSKKRRAANKTHHQILSFTHTAVFSFFLIALAAFLVYSNSFDCQFHFDDENSIVSNHQIRDLSSFTDTDYWLNAYRPLAIFSFALNYHFTNLDVFGYHLVNLFIHIIAGFFVFLLIKLILDLNNYKNYKIEMTKNWFALLTTLVFIVHPIQTQAITYIVQRMTSMAAMFYIMSVYFYAVGRIAHIQKNNTSRAFLFYLSALISGVLGVITKQSAATFPLAFLLFEICFIRNRENKVFKKYIIASSTVLIVIGSLFLYYNRQLLSHALHGANISSIDYLINQFVVIVKYLQLVLLPISQCADYGNIIYGFPFIKTFWRFDAIACFLLLMGLLALAFFLFKKNKAVSFGIFWFFLTLSVESSFIPITDLMFEHRVYLPMAGMSIFLMSSIFMLGSKLKTTYLYSSAALLIIVLGILSYSRNEIWNNDLTLWTDVVKRVPNNARAWYNIGVFYKNLGNNEEAIEYFDRAIEIKPDYCDAMLNKGVAIALLEKPEKAIQCYDKVIEIQPDNFQIWNNKGSALENMGKYDEAIISYNKAIEIKPDYELLWFNKGVTLSKSGKHEEAIISYNKATEIKPGFDLAWYNKGDALSILGKHKEAIECYDKAIEIKPDAYEVWNNKGTVFEKLGKYEEAIMSYDKAIEIKSDYFLAWYNKGVAFSLAGKQEEAVKCYDKVIEINPAVYEAWNNKGIVLEKLGRFEEAVQCYDKALGLQPSFDTARNNKYALQKKIMILRRLR